MKGSLHHRLAWPACVLVLFATAAAQAQAPSGKRQPAAPMARATRSFNLFAGAIGAENVLLTGNRVQCNITDFGNSCVNPYGSGTIEGGFWPANSVDAYVFNGGLEVGAVVPTDAGFKWAGDTVGIFFMDPRGSQRMGSNVSGLFDSRNASDLAVWPTAAYANDTSLFDARLIGRAAISDQDTWVRYWDGNPSVGAGRSHMMGMVVDQRTLAFNRGFHQDILYFIYRLINVTSRLRQSYSGLAAAGYSAADQQQLAALGAALQDSAQARDTALRFPIGGYRFRNLYVGYFQDPDVGIQNDHNFSTAVLPFSLVAAIKSNYYEPAWQFPPSIFSAPFAAAPGYVAVKYLRTAVDSTGRQVGISVWSNTVGGGGGLHEAVGVPNLYRLLSGRPSSTADGGCNSNTITTRTCLAEQSYADTRYYESTGLMDLAPGQSVVIAVAMIFAAPVAQWAATTNGIYAMPAGNLSTYVRLTDNTFTPGWPSTAESLAVFGNGPSRGGTGSNTRVRDAVERPMGWGQFSDMNGDGRIEASEVQTVPGSLLGKAQYAQAMFDRKFLVPRPPDAPNFFLIPGDGRVTIAWQKSATETTGDPYFAIASDPTTGLYDPNFRRLDVEGYRIWRGTSASNLKLIAQFDYQGTVFSDYNGQIYDTNVYGYQCAPELGVTTSCPAFPHNVPLAGNLVQVRPGDRILAADGSIFVARIDTAVIGGSSGMRPLVDNGVPFAFTDTTLTNSFPYVYAVTAFDVNSIASGPSSLESPLVTKTVTPRVGSGQEMAGAVSAPVLLGASGDTLDPTVPLPTLDKTTGEFSGPMPPANGGGLGFMAFVPQVLASGAGSLTLRVDSVHGGDAWDGVGGFYFVTVGSAKFAVPFNYDLTNAAVDTSIFAFPAQPLNAAKSARFGGDTTYALYGNLTTAMMGAYYSTESGHAAVNGVGGYYSGSRWWSGSANENTPNPNGGICKVYPGTSCTHVNHSAGALPGVDSLYMPQAYGTTQSSPMRYLEGHTAALKRAADFSVYWGAAGVVDSVVDVTHHVHVPFMPGLDASWGILNDSSFVNTNAARTRDGNNNLLTWSDIFCVDPADTLLGNNLQNVCTFGGTVTPAVFMNHARLSPIAAAAASFAGTAALSATGNGFIFYLNGEFFLMQMAALPTNVVWHERAYIGLVKGDSTGTFAFTPGIRPINVPGLRIRLSYQGAVLNPKSTTAAELAAVHTVPDPYYNHSAYETVGGERQLRFVNLPAQCLIRIYSASGILVTMLVHNDATGGGEEPWNLLSRNGHEVASGVYFYHVETPDHRSKVGRFTIVKVTS